MVVFAWVLRQTLQLPTTPAWIRRQEEQDQVTSWRKLPRLFRFIFLLAFAATMIGLLWNGALYTHYMLYAPRAADPQSGRIYPSEFKGVTCFLSAEELVNYKRSQHAMIVAWVATFGLGLGGSIWSKRKSRSRDQR
jgi:hypothetical protein